MATRNGGRARFVVCVRNTGYPASLEVRKIYRALSDRSAKRHDMLRIVDESGEDYPLSGQVLHGGEPTAAPAKCVAAGSVTGGRVVRATAPPLNRWVVSACCCSFKSEASR